MELLIQGPHGLIAWRVRLRDRAATWLHAQTLDERLADGVAPEAHVEYALRAHKLTRPRMRSQLARGVERAIDAATGRQASPFAVLDRRQAAGALPELHALLARLDAGGVPCAQGVAGAHLLLTDGCGPLYNPGAARTLRDAVSAVLESFD